MPQDMAKVADGALIRLQQLNSSHELDISETHHFGDLGPLGAYLEHLQKTVTSLEQQVKNFQRINQHDPTPAATAENEPITMPNEEERTSLENSVEGFGPQQPKPSPTLRPDAEGTKTMESIETATSSNGEKVKDDESLSLTVYREIKISERYNREHFPDTGDRESFERRFGFADRREPITCRRVFSKTRAHLKTVMKINSTILIDALKETLSPSRDRYYSKLHSYKANIHKPYVIFFQNRQRLQNAAEAYQQAGKTQQAALLKLLLDFLKEHMPDTWETLDRIETGKCTHIQFSNAWLLYSPGMTVYTKHSGRLMAYKVAEVETRLIPRVTPITINAYNLNFGKNGSCLVPVAQRLRISPFSGERSISHLEVVPESHLDDRNSISASLRSRGRIFWEFHGEPAYRQYRGTAWLTTLSSDYTKVMVDYVTSSRHGHGDSYSDDDSDNEGDCSCPSCGRKYAGLASYPEAAEKNVGQDVDLEELLIFCPSVVWAFSLKHKSWERAEVENLSPVQSQNDPFKKLVLDPDHKTVVESMVETQVSNTVSDIIKEKGRGLVVLLHGGPGTGKTLTAGTDPNELEKNLERVFRNAVNWKAVLLLDEADVFLQERDLQNLERNALVSVFLRHIEYYDGILFLTTNRPGQIDEAFQSRIHITLGLPDLDFGRQKQVWHIFINQLQFPGEEKEARKQKKLELLRFVQNELEPKLNVTQHKMNGRQIRNCLRAASAIANKHGRTVEKKDILSVIDLGTQFRDYMAKLNRMNQEEKARALGLRYPGAN
ncbi:hypothetical protein DL764_003879 [Monosporascus ibericus]|uniref:AAA+ ATPase domain-containing protein n=1 Tax=Monosporascus ibericus TaxID=155417 RepID=A0A4Q4THI2_9PEZI|nr:hypothetical protein DL764_003879 [Monosporascus ibericus]